MTTYFFDFTDGTYTTTDREGHECEDAEAACMEALCALPEIYLAGPKGAGHRELTCSVRDVAGSVVYRATLALKGQRSPNR